MYVLGLTGSIAMGKSWGVECFHHSGIPVHDADACVHNLLASGGRAAVKVGTVFPGVLRKEGAVDRRKLSDQVFSDGRALAVLESILHPLVREDQRCFLARHARAGRTLVVLDIPLLFETNAQKHVDGVVVMSAPLSVQKYRILCRPYMMIEKFNFILAMQIPDRIKCLGADFVVRTGGTRGQSLRQMVKIVKITQQRKGKVWGPNWP